MISFLTSSFIEYQIPEEFEPKPLLNQNGFADNLKKYWKENSKFLIFANDPKDFESNDHVKKEMYYAFTLAGFSISEIRIFDDRSVINIKETLLWADVLYIAGGHGPTQNAFMHRCGLRKALMEDRLFDGILIALSAGMVNCAEDAYLVPELPGESTDIHYQRFAKGLGIMHINTVPHYQYAKTLTLDGRKLIDEIVAEDSMGRDIYLIPDGSYFLVIDGTVEFFGEGLIMNNKIKRPLYSGIINSENKRTKEDCLRIFDSVVSGYYDCVLELNTENGEVDFLYASELLPSYDIIPVEIKTFDELNRLLSEKLIVQEEKSPFLEQIEIGVVLDEMKTRGGYVRTIHIDTEDGVRAENLRVLPIAGRDKHFIVTITDISQVLDHDWMTDEYSRSGFLKKAERMLREDEFKEGYSLVYTNIQGFKAVNDVLGTYSGDMVIFMTRSVLFEELKPALIARLESDHFALLVKDENLSEDRLLKMCHQVYEEGSKRMPLLIRCGIYRIKDTTRKVQHMLDRAKLAENSIPSDHGVPYKVCDEELRDNYVEQRMLVSEIDSALSKGEFKTYYQPVVLAETGEIVSAEALIRWVHSEKGMISPGKYIPVFEKEGLISKIDSFMVDNVLSLNLKRVKNKKKVVPCAVNLSRVDFYDMGLLEVIKKKLALHKNIEDMLKLEVTESAYAVLEKDAIAFLEEMRRLKIGLMLDDFGSGMSSLSTLESFEFDVIKLDMGFISQIGKSKKAEAIIKHTIGLAHDVGARLVAEGVETKEQLEFLKEADCDMIQGYYFYKPMPQEEFEKLLDEKN